MTQQLTFEFQDNLKIQDSKPTTTHRNVPGQHQRDHEHEHEHEHDQEQEQEPAVSFEHGDDDADDEEEEEKEFSFSCCNPDGSPVSPSSAFRDGQIRPMLPLFDTSLLLTVQPGDAAAATAFSSSSSSPPFHFPSSSSSSASLKKLFSGDGVEAVEEVTMSEACKKSNSTGHSKVWKFRDLMTTLNRSNSDGKDAFVFLKNGHAKGENVAEKKKNKMKSKTKTAAAAAASAHEKLYVKNRERKEEEKRKSYLPYRQGLVGLGFFTNINHGLSRNMHPY